MDRMGKSFRELLESPDFFYGVELVSTRGIPDEGEAAKPVELGEALASDARTGWLSVTDNPGGHPMLPPDWLAHMLSSSDAEIAIHLACKDLNRNGLESAAWRYAAEGYNNILALTGDYPAEGFSGQAAPVFDLDSVSLIAMLKAMNEGLTISGPGGKKKELPQTHFYTGCAVSPFKRHERELMPQYFKLARKIHCGAEWVVPQLGYDMRKFYEVRLFMDWAQVSAPIVGNVYLLNRIVARLFNQNQIPGCVVSDELNVLAQKYGKGEDKGRAFFYELAAKQLAVFKGLGFAAGYIGGVHKPQTFFEIVDIAESFAEDDWKQFAKDIQYPQQDEFYLFEQDPETGLGDLALLNSAYKESLVHPEKSDEVTLGYRMSRKIHDGFFKPGEGQFPHMQKLYERLEKKGDTLASKALYAIEHASKQMAFGCKDCGDCSLPDTAYLCPRNACSKTGRNGPCGGSRDGRCELDDKECLWARAYERLKYYHESEDMLKGPAVFYNAKLDHTSSWANTFLGRDHHRAASPSGDAPAPPKGADPQAPDEKPKGA